MKQIKQQILFTVALLLSAIYASAYSFEVNGIYYNIVSSSNKTCSVTYKTTDYNSYSGMIVVPSKVTYNSSEYTVTGIGDYAFRDCTSLTYIKIPETVTSIGSYAFRGCSGLTSVTIPNSVKSIGNYAFYGCSGLTSVTIPNSVTSIGNYAFRYCDGLTSVTIPNSVMSIGDYAFSGCSGLTSVTIPNSVTSIGSSAFSHCSGLTSVTIPNSVTSIGDYTFYNCTGLTSVTIPNSVTSIGSDAFDGCYGLTSVTIPNSVTSIGDYAFYWCDNLKTLTIGSGVATIGANAFCVTTSGKYNLMNVSINRTIPPTITSDTFKNRTFTLHVIKGYADVYKSDAFWNRFTIVDDIEINAESISLDKKTYYCKPNEVITPKVTITPDDVAEILMPVWSTSDESVLMVDNKSGQILALQDGAATITASVFGADGKMLTATAIVVVGSGITPVVKKCAAPVITFENGEIKCTSETEGAKCSYNYTVTNTSGSGNDSGKLALKLQVTAYASAYDYDQSESVTKTFDIQQGATSCLKGDVNGDGKVTIADANDVVNIYLGK